MNFEQMDKKLHLFNSELNSLKVNPSDFIFEERVKVLCFHCKHYNNKWTCPGKNPNLNYKHIFLEYLNGMIVSITYPIDDDDFSEIRKNSTIIIHRALLHLEKFLYENNNSTSLSFIGGSCKLCKKGCGINKCNNPYAARIPLEGTGCNVVKSLGIYGIEIKFPVKNFISRYGLILW